MKRKLYRIMTISCSFNELLNGQLGFLNNYYNVSAIANDTGSMKDVAEQQGVKTISIKMARKISLWQDLKSLWNLFRLFKKDRPDIVHANTPKASLLSMVAAWMARVPHRIYTVTGLRFETTSGLLRFILINMERITCMCATKVIPEGDGVRDTLLKENITKKPLIKILNGNINGIDLNYFCRNEDIMEKMKHIRKDNLFTFIFIGRIVRDKGVNELVEAFNKLSKVTKNIRLLLVGRFEDELDPIAQQTRDILEQNPRIEVLGYQKDVRPFLAASDILILPSYREGFPNVVIQAGAMGLPSIVTDINGCNEIIIDKENGIIIPKMNTDELYASMLRVTTDIKLVEKMANKARDMVANRYNQKDVWQAILEMYNSL